MLLGLICSVILVCGAAGKHDQEEPAVAIEKDPEETGPPHKWVSVTRLGITADNTLLEGNHEIVIRLDGR